ncbi:PQQ-binding-like beta-propeller repeat protein [Natrialbaceae archaeon AArc-T1-2]|uniref:outer membrane protein assembly factor BamB family protein n=1 Tax=Natrialbaceae archaeon AArc-T1-2 TaxID=3053904 RepID=UPI00255B0D38|nr:PQQ-binding-like beta-propeller repeat protein [Natrialbaceae archaeon AArc-T1-2]WIV66246.1 PQQ-binding-like beta-propeller repeat protein [Natrialbaceae archaeon AArc-T1-2]
MPSIDRRRLLGTAAAALVGSVAVRRIGAQPDREPATRSPGWHHPERDGGNTASTTDPGPRTDGEIGWERRIDTTDSGGFSGFAQWDETLLVPGDRRLVAIDTASGDQQWRFAPADRRWSLDASPRVRDATAFLPSRSVYVNAVDLETRRLRWRYRTDGSIHATTLAGSLLCFSSFLDGNRRVIALETETGTERWRSPGQWHDAGATGDVIVAVRRRENRNLELKLAGVDLETGETVWSGTPDGFSLSLGSQVVACEDRALVTGHEGVVVLEAATGERRATLEGVPAAGGLAVGPDGERVYVTDPWEEAVTGVDLASDDRWTVETAAESGIAVGDDTVYVATADGLLALDATDGERRFAVEPEMTSPTSRPSRIETTPLVSGDVVYHRIGEAVYEVRRP